jgi:hypothetical protein
MERDDNIVAMAPRRREKEKKADADSLREFWKTLSLGR